MKEKKYITPPDEELVNSWMTDFSGREIAAGRGTLPRFEQIWKDAFLEKSVKRELIEKAMLPMRITGLFGGILTAVGLVVLLLSGKTVLAGIRAQLGQAGEALFAPILRMFNSSIFVSIPMTLVLVSILLYLLFSIVNSLTGRSPERI